MNKAIIVFFIITLINVVLSTVKSVLTVKASRRVASLINAIAYGFYAMVVKQMATVSTEVVVIATVLCNLVGVYFSLWLLDKTSKDVLWKITILPRSEQSVEDIKIGLEKAGTRYNEYTVNASFGPTKALDVFSKTSEESRKIKEILKEFDQVKYHVVELNKVL